MCGLCCLCVVFGHCLILSVFVWLVLLLVCVIAGICRSCSVLVFVVWLFGVCCQPRLFASFVIVCCCCCVMVFVVVVMIVCVVSCWVCGAMMVTELCRRYSCVKLLL